MTVYGPTERNTALRVKRTSRAPSTEPAHASIPRSRSARSQEYTFSVGAWRQLPPAPPPARERPMSAEGDMATGYAGNSHLSTAKAWKQTRGRAGADPRQPCRLSEVLLARRRRQATHEAVTTAEGYVHQYQPHRQVTSRGVLFPDSPAVGPTGQRHSADARRTPRTDLDAEPNRFRAGIRPLTKRDRRGQCGAGHPRVSGRSGLRPGRTGERERTLPA